ncbi:MAG: SDR family oxidoreductase [Planctomycetes bacterium]|nr:SDR family oxidoreductase [Planctomycetota bacterium]
MDQVVLLSGATGALGSAFARHALACGARLAATVRREWQVEQVRAALGSERVLVGVVEAQDGEAAAGFVKGANDALGPITALVCTAGLFGTHQVGSDPAGELLRLVQANLLAGANLARAVLPGMRRRRRGTLTFVGSSAVGRDLPLSANYLASKAALHEFVRALALSLDGSGVRAAAILPDTFDTEANREAMPAADRTGWVSIEQGVLALADHAFGPGSEGGPLFPVLGNR